MSTPRELLSHFAVSTQEADIYTALLALGKSGVTDIAKKIGKNRTAVYFHLNNLVKKNLVREARKGRVLQFIAVPPSELATSFERWATDFKSLVPQLESLQKIDAETPVIEVIESKLGFYRIYDELSSMPEGEKFRVLEGKNAMAKELSLLTQQQWQAFFARMVERGIQTHGIFTEEAFAVIPKKFEKKTLQVLSQRKWQLRLLPEKTLPFEQLLFIYGNKIAFVFPETALVLTITHRHVAEAMATLFDTLFSFAKPAHLS